MDAKNTIDVLINPTDAQIANLQLAIRNLDDAKMFFGRVVTADALCAVMSTADVDKLAAELVTAMDALKTLTSTSTDDDYKKALLIAHKSLFAFKPFLAKIYTNKRSIGLTLPDADQRKIFFAEMNLAVKNLFRADDVIVANYPPLQPSMSDDYLSIQGQNKQLHSSGSGSLFDKFSSSPLLYLAFGVIVGWIIVSIMRERRGTSRRERRSRRGR